VRIIRACDGVLRLGGGGVQHVDYLCMCSMSQVSSLLPGGAETVAGATIPVYVACWTLAAIAPVDFWLGPASGSRAAQLAAPAGHDEPEPELRWAEVIRVPVPPTLCVRLENLLETQYDERRAAYVAFKAAVCRAVNVSARSLEAV
jgi:hypothetical protein